MASKEDLRQELWLARTMELETYARRLEEQIEEAEEKEEVKIEITWRK